MRPANAPARIDSQRSTQRSQRRVEKKFVGQLSNLPYALFKRNGL